MKNPALFLAVVLSAASIARADDGTPPAASAKRAAAPKPPKVPSAPESPLKLGPPTPEGFNDPAHLHFFRYQLYLRNNGLEGLDEAAWKALSADQRTTKLKAGEDWLKDKLTALMSAQYPSADDSSLLAAVWGPDVAAATAAVAKSLKLGDPEQIKAARARVQGMVKGVGGASVDWASIFDGSAPTTPTDPKLPDPLALKKTQGFLASLDSPAVQAPLASKATFVHYLQDKSVPPDAMPALVAMYDVLTHAKGQDMADTKHLLPTVIRFLNDGHRIVDQDEPGALAFAVPGEYDRPERVGITSAVRTADPVLVGDVLSHEFEHIYDMYSGRYYTLDSELRGFKTNVAFMNIMKSDPRLSKKLDELMASNDDTTRAVFHRDAEVAAALTRSPQEFADEVAFGQGYNHYEQGTFSGRLPLREATNPDTGLQRQISAQRVLLERARADTAALTARLATPLSDTDMEKATRDLSSSQRRETYLQQEITLGTLRLNRMRREVDWVDRRAAAAGQAAPAYDLSLPVDKQYIVDGE